MIKRFLYLVATDQLNGFAATMIKLVLWLSSGVYRFCITIRGFLYNIGIFPKTSLSHPVISIGNLTVGGTGKTPFVEYVARALMKKDARIVVLTRGYRVERSNTGNQVSDEAQMLKKNLSNVPILVGGNRIKNAQKYLQHNTADIFVMDDGFQHYQLSRDLDIVTVDATNPWGNGCLLPRGVLRESLNALKRGHVFVLTKTDLGAGHLEELKAKLKSINPEALIIETIHEPDSFTNPCSTEIVGLDLVKGKKICAVSSIGAPDSFAQTLINLDADVQRHFAFMDHHSYCQKDIEWMIKFCHDQAITMIVTTQKDIVKLQHFLSVIPDPICLWSLRIKIGVVTGEDQLLERIHHIL